MENGFFNKSSRSAFIGGKLEDLKSAGFKANQILPGKIIRKTSFEPQYEGHQPKVNPTTGEKVLVNGRETYFQDVYTQDMNACDTWVGQDTNAVSAEVANALTEQTV